MTTTTRTPTILFIAGYWLGAWAWDEVLAHLRSTDVRAVAITLPGLDPADPARATRTLDDQATAISDALSELGVSADEPAIIVVHSGANAPVSVVLDRHPELVARVVWVDSGPVSPAPASAVEPPTQTEGLPLPPFDVLAQEASLDGLSAEVLDRFRTRAVPEPGPVVGRPVVLANDDRRRIPTTFICCSIRSAQVQELAQAGHPMFAEVATLEDVEMVDLPTGHWPMWSRPRDLAELVHSAAVRS
ncbi:MULTISPECIES: alpha/beta fold hydrolase [unclassified Microbacterium]|uniref:alpha/beta fold hydrolase n=1 Tax=unclassified Microbacterium TaxID=2609290 RepID=UPI003016D0E4